MGVFFLEVPIANVLLKMIVTYCLTSTAGVQGDPEKCSYALTPPQVYVLIAALNSETGVH